MGQTERLIVASWYIFCSMKLATKETSNICGVSLFTGSVIWPLLHMSLKRFINIIFKHCWCTRDWFMKCDGRPYLYVYVCMNGCHLYLGFVRNILCSFFFIYDIEKINFHKWVSSDFFEAIIFYLRYRTERTPGKRILQTNTAFQNLVLLDSVSISLRCWCSVFLQCTVYNFQ